MPRRKITRRDALLAACGAIAGARFARATIGPVAKSPIAAIADYEAASGGHVGLYAENIRTGEKLLWRDEERFVMCSTFKASLAACVLSRVDQGSESLGSRIHYGAADLQHFHAPVAQKNLPKGVLSVYEMCRAAVEQSDNACANLLLARIGGPAVLTAFWRTIGDRLTRLDDYEPLLNETPLGDERNTTTPAAMANTLRVLTLGNVLSPKSRTVLTGWLINCQTGANRLRAGLPREWVIGDKTGNNGHDAAGDIAIAWPAADVPVVICVYTRAGSPTSAQIDTLFASLGKVVAARLGPKG
jgi:beta-lactamase class A